MPVGRPFSHTGISGNDSCRGPCAVGIGYLGHGEALVLQQAWDGQGSVVAHGLVVSTVYKIGIVLKRQPLAYLHRALGPNVGLVELLITYTVNTLLGVMARRNRERGLLAAARNAYVVLVTVCGLAVEHIIPDRIGKVFVPTRVIYAPIVVALIGIVLTFFILVFPRLVPREKVIYPTRQRMFRFDIRFHEIVIPHHHVGFVLRTDRWLVH